MTLSLTVGILIAHAALYVLYLKNTGAGFVSRRAGHSSRECASLFGTDVDALHGRCLALQPHYRYEYALVVHSVVFCHFFTGWYGLIYYGAYAGESPFLSQARASFIIFNVA